MPFVGNPSTDWVAIAIEYSANQCSIRALARKHRVSEGAIRKRAKQARWVRGAGFGTQIAPRAYRHLTEIVTILIGAVRIEPGALCIANDNGAV